MFQVFNIPVPSTYHFYMTHHCISILDTPVPNLSKQKENPVFSWGCLSNWNIYVFVTCFYNTHLYKFLDIPVPFFKLVISPQVVSPNGTFIVITAFLRHAFRRNGGTDDLLLCTDGSSASFLSPLTIIVCKFGFVVNAYRWIVYIFSTTDFL